MNKLILVTNPGSASRKYALYRGLDCLAKLHFEYVNNKAVCELETTQEKKEVPISIDDIAQAAGECQKILQEHGIISKDETIDIIGARVVAPSRDFWKDQLVTPEVIAKLEVLKSKAPLHTTVAIKEIENFRNAFPDLPIVAISDSSFHSDKPKKAFYYALDTDLQDKLDIGCFSYHGISVSSIVEIMKQDSILPEKMVVCHLGGGATINAVVEGKGVDSSIGYSPLGGVMMATRCGDIDLSAALAIKKELDLDDQGLEVYLNKKAGFLGMSALSDDMRLVLAAEAEGNQKAKLANETYIYRLVKAIGAMVGAINGIDSIVFTATVGERGADVREKVINNLTYLGFELDQEKNLNHNPKAKIDNIATANSKPIYVIRTDELTEMVRRTIAITSN